MRGFVKQCLLAAAFVSAAPAFAGNLDFETSNLSDWTRHGNGAALNSYGSFAPVSGDFFAAIEAGRGQNIYSTLSQSFNLVAGATITGYAGFQARDYMPFNDDGYLSVNGQNLLTWDVASVGDYGATGWQQFTFIAPTDGVYLLELGVANQMDNSLGYSSGAVLDNVSVTGIVPPAVPEPASWAMMLGGFGLVGGAMRARTRKLRFA